MADEVITQKYIRRYPDSKRTRCWAGRLVHIQTENGVWRKNAKGYTYAHHADAWVLPFEEAQQQVNHCGPEKKAAFILARIATVYHDSPDHVVYRTALEKIDAIRNSIIGFQNVGWSEHIYPLVAALEEAGFHGVGYEKNRADAKTMRETTIAAIDRAEGAEAHLKTANDLLERLTSAVEQMRVPQNTVEAGMQVMVTIGPCVSAARSYLTPKVQQA